MPATCSAI